MPRRTLNLGILAHVDAGKTTLTERLLYAAGVIDQVGSVDAGTTLTDSLALERQRGITGAAAAAHPSAAVREQDRPSWRGRGARAAGDRGPAVTGHRPDGVHLRARHPRRRLRETTAVCIERPAGSGEAAELLGAPGNPFPATLGLRVDPGPVGSGVAFRLDVDIRSVPMYVYKTAGNFAEMMTQYVGQALREGGKSLPLLVAGRRSVASERDTGGVCYRRVRAAGHDG